MTAIACLSLMAPIAASAQQSDASEADTVVYQIDPVVVTATRGPRVVSDIPTPVSVVQRRDLIEKAPNTVSDLFRSLPGLDVTGVGVQQVRPQIRGQSGQRILLLEDGMRMNNTRRQRDFGELPALVDVDAVQQVEVVRGPASVLYGSDAIGGVVNIITEAPTAEGFDGTLGYQYGSASDLGRVSLRMMGRRGAFSVRGGVTGRAADSYSAPAGSFGDITLNSATQVQNSGVQDLSFDTRLGWDFTSDTEVFGKVEHYQENDAGFGYVAPDAYAPDQPTIDIRYPKQRFTKITSGVRAHDLGIPGVDDLNLTVYGQDNERNLVFDADIPFFPGAGMTLDNRNFTDIRTYGFRAEARKLIVKDVLLTYGADGFRDRADGTDNNTSTIYGFGPPMIDQSNVPSIPNAAYRSIGAFLQSEVNVGDRLSLIGGGRYQTVNAKTYVTPNLNNTPTSESNSTVVGALNAEVKVLPGLSLVTSVGRAFRSPNLIELFFDGAVPEASSYQIPSQGLKAETSFNVDLGARYQNDALFVEGFLFRNKLSNGIRARPVVDQAGDTVQTNGLATYQNVNVDEIILRGAELNADVRLEDGITLGSSYSHLRAKDALDPENPIGESYADKVTGRAGYRDPAGRFWAEWETRFSGRQKDAALEVGNPLGTVLPSFWVHGIRAGARIAESDGFIYGLTVSLDNLTNELYAETANGSFFRPEPGRNVTVSMNVSF